MKCLELVTKASASDQFKNNNYFHSSQNSWHLSYWSSSPLTLLMGTLGRPNIGRRGRNSTLEDRADLCHIFEYPPSYCVPHMCIPNVYLWKIRKLPQECPAWSELMSKSFSCRKSRFSNFKYLEICYTAEMTLYWDPRNFHHPALSRCHFLLPAQDVGGRCTSI